MKNRHNPWTARGRWLGVLGLVLCLTAAAGRAAAQAGAPTFFITQVDAAAFPQVSFTLRAVNEANQTVAGLNNALAIFEDGQPVPAAAVQVTARDDGPILYLFVVDQGVNTNYTAFGLANTRQIFSTLVDGGYFVDGRDTVEVLVRENVNSDRTEVRLPATSSRDEFLNWIATYPFERRSAKATRGLEGVGDALAEAARLVNPAGSGTVAVFFVTRRIEEPISSVAVQAAEKWARDARAGYVSVNVFHLESSTTSRQPLETLAQGANGQYVTLVRNNVPTLVGAVYQGVNAQRALYSVTYASPGAGSAPRTITVNAPQAPAAGLAGTYQVAVAPPAVALTAPQAGAILNRARSGGALAPLSVDVRAAITWPDGYPRALQSARLSVNGAAQTTVTPTAGADTLDFSADLAAITTPGSNVVTLAVDVTDALGLTSSARVDVTVAVEAEPVPPTATPAPTPTPVPAIPAGATAAVLGGLVCGGLVLLGGGAGVGFYLWRRRKAAPPPVPAPPPAPAAQATVIMSRARPVPAAAASGSLTVLEGPDGRVGEVIPLAQPVTRLGRNPQAVDVVFYPEGESSVSRLHCLIERAAGAAYTLVDKGSTSGTRLNGRPLPAETPTLLTDGDEISLGEPSQRGVRLRFQAGGPPGEERTRVIRRSGGT